MYTKNVRFEWDSEKARRNSLKHGVGFKEATTAFDDLDGLIADDEEHSETESRQWLIGESALRRVLVVIFTVRASIIRIISARPASTQERKTYEESISL